MQSNLAKRQLIVSVSFIVLLYFVLWSSLSVTKSICFILPTD